jgi:hypothetical protein
MTTWPDVATAALTLAFAAFVIWATTREDR